jgi:hypothetical protein
MIKNNIINWLIIILITILWIFHSQLFWYFWYENLIVDWNYEYTKVMLFNILFPIIFLIFIISNFITKQKINISKNILFYLVIIIILLSLSSYFSIIPNISFFWWIDKWHWYIFNINLILFFILVSHILSNTKLNILLKSTLVVTSLLTLIWIKEYYLPSYNYWDLWNRLISTLGHPNYVSALYILVFPYLINLFKNYCWYKKYISWIIILLFLFWLVLTKSLIAIFLIFTYIIFEIFWKYKTKYYFIFIIFLALFWLLLIFKYYPEKLNSLVSRYYIWETSISIIFSDMKIFLFWIWSENLNLLFWNHKSIELYLYENIWFNADRPHNIFLNIFIHYGFILFSLVVYLFYKLVENISKNNYWYDCSLFLIIIFWCFNFPNIIWYFFFIIILAYKISKSNIDKISYYRQSIITNLIIFLLILISIFWSYYSVQSYRSQISIKQDNYSQAVKQFPYYWEYYYNNLDFDNWLISDNNYYSEKYYLYKLYFSFKKIESCNELLVHYPSIENYFYCWELIENKYWLDQAKYFYKKWIEKFPNIWDNKNNYLQSFPWKYVINPERILHTKYSNIQEILNKLEIK